MKSTYLIHLLIIALISPVLAQAQSNSNTDPDSIIQFLGGDFLYRRSDNNQHEFTPRGQEDLTKWKDMLTITHYQDIVYDDKLQQIATATYQLYKNEGAEILKTGSTPKARKTFREFTIVAVFNQPKFSEVVFAKFEIIHRMGTTSIYSHRIHGKDTKKIMDLWIQTHQAKIEKAFDIWSGPPSDLTIQHIKD